MLSEFEFYRPETLAEALALLAEHGTGLAPMAGGTNVIPDLRSARLHAKALLDISGLRELRGMRRLDGQIVAGAATTITELLREPLVGETAPAVAQAAASFANPLVRNRATLGGNLADASPAADMAPPLLALGAVVELASAGGVRCLPLEDFLTGVRKTLRRPDELVIAVRWPAGPSQPGLRAAGAFYKIGLRKSDAISVLSAAVSLTFDEAGLCRDVGIALGAVAPRPLRAHRAEAILRGQSLTPAHLAEAAYLAAEAARPISDIRGSAVYRRQVTETITRRLLVQACQAACPTMGGST
jgi:CO/xanthine dehydrogenase FAD-binding subunit